MWKRLSTFRRGFASTFVFNVIARGLSAIATVLVIRSLSIDAFAYLVLFLNIGQFAGSALTGGIRMRYMRVEAERVSRGHQEPTGFALAWTASMALVLVASALCLIGVALLAPLPAEGHNYVVFAALATAFTAAHASIELSIYHHQAHLQFVRGGLVDVGRGAAMVAAALTATFGVIESGPKIAAATAAAVAAVAVVACLPLIVETLKTRALASIAGDFGRESGWLTVYFLTSAAFAYVTIFVVAIYLDDEALGSYGAALRYLSIVFGPYPALMAIMRVRTSQKDMVDSTRLQLRMLADWVKRVGPPTAAFLALAALAAPVIIPFVDDGLYPQTVAIFQILLISAFVEYTLLPGPNLLLSQRRYRLLAGWYSVALAVQVVAVVTAASMEGVIVVTAVATIVRSVSWVGITILATRVRSDPP